MDVLDGVDPKEFKKLWTQPVKDGWKARPPTGLNVGLTYVEPGVKGKLCKDRVNVNYFGTTYQYVGKVVSASLLGTASLPAGPV
ncbi:hypothetical protein DVH05_016564 [Phytophthora capsici]|nr:hypothetical protein DVH05_016564 [Phytophthora capsici]